MQVSVQYPLKILAGACIFFATLLPAWAFFPRPAPGPEELDQANLARFEAFAHYAWGVLLELEEGLGSAKAQEQFLAALRAMPASLPLFEQATRVWRWREDYQRMAEALHPIALENPQVEHLQIAAALALRESGRLEESTTLLDHAYHAIHPRSARLLREFSSSLWREQRYVDVNHLLTRAGHRPELADSFDLEFARTIYFHSLTQAPPGTDFTTALRTRFLKRSRQHARRAAALFNEDVQFSDVSRLLEVLQDAEAWPTAHSLIDRVRPLFPSQEFELAFQKSFFWRLAGDPVQARESLAQLNGLIPLEFEAHVRVGREYLELDEFEKSSQYLKNAFHLRPEVIHVRYLFAVAALLAGHYSEAYQALEAVEEPDQHILFLQSRSAMGMKKYEQAWRLAVKAEARADDTLLTAHFYLYLATIKDKLGDADGMLEMAEKAYQLDSDDWEVQNFVGYTLADQGRQLERAERLIAAAVASQPENLAIRDSLAWVYYRQGRFEEALREINHTLQLAVLEDTRNSEIFSHAGDIYAATGYPRLAIHYWKLAIQEIARDPEKLRAKIQEMLEKSKP